MICPNCGEDLIWGGDFSFEDYGREGDGIISNYSCNGCPIYVEIHLPIESEETNDN